MSNYLTIPHTRTLQVRVRSFEIAKALHLRKHESFYLGGSTACITNFSHALRVAVSEALRMDEIIPIEGVKYLRPARIYKPSWAMKAQKRVLLERILREYQVDTLISADFDGVPPLHNYKGMVICDLVDDTFGFPGEEGAKRATPKALIETMRRADIIVAASDELAALAQGLVGGTAKVISVPNGVWVEEYEKSLSKSVTQLRSKYHLPVDKAICLMSGHLSSWTGVDFIEKLFNKHAALLKNHLLLLVGPSYREIQNSENVRWLGPVAWSQMPEIIHLADKGLIPFDPCEFTHKALPLKAVEYSIMRKHIIATPLRQLIKLNWPNVTFVPQREDEWLRAIQYPGSQAEGVASDIRAYDWTNLVEPIADLVK
jgi:hypothetical protein